MWAPFLQIKVPLWLAAVETLKIAPKPGNSCKLTQWAVSILSGFNLGLYLCMAIFFTQLYALYLGTRDTWKQYLGTLNPGLGPLFKLSFAVTPSFSWTFKP